MSEVDVLIARWADRGRRGLIPLLQDVQRHYGYLPDHAILEVAEALGLPAVKVWGVATYYDRFRFRARGRHHVRLCRGTACHVAASRRLLEAVMRGLAIRPGQTTPDGLFSLELVPCLGACAQAPVVEIDGRIHGSMTAERFWTLLAALDAEGAWGFGGEGARG